MEDSCIHYCYLFVDFVKLSTKTIRYMLVFSVQLISIIVNCYCHVLAAWRTSTDFWVSLINSHVFYWQGIARLVSNTQESLPWFLVKHLIYYLHFHVTYSSPKSSNSLYLERVAGLHFRSITTKGCPQNHGNTRATLVVKHIVHSCHNDNMMMITMWNWTYTWYRFSSKYVIDGTEGELWRVNTRYKVWDSLLSLTASHTQTC